MKTIVAASIAGLGLLLVESAWAQDTTLTSSTSTAATVAAPASTSAPPPPPPSKEVVAEAPPENQRLLSTTDEPIPRAFVIYENARIGAFLKPVLQLSTSVVGYMPKRDGDTEGELSGRTSTMLLARFGVEGRLTDWISFRSVFERNVGYSLRRNGPVGTSVWEGMASIQARENYIRVEKWGLQLTGGIVPDPASVDFISDNVLDTFGMDPYVRDPLLYSGFNQGQGLLLRYTRWGATAGLAFTAGNPLISSLAFGFGGDVSTLGTLYDAPVRAIASGLPGSDIHMIVISPSLGYEHELFAVKAALQFYDVDVNLTESEDKPLSGYNLRATAEVKPLQPWFGDLLRIFGSAAYRTNQQIDKTNAAMYLDNDYEGLVLAGGADVTYGDFSIGGQYYRVRTESTVDRAFTYEFANVGATYWVWERTVSAGFRWAFSDVSSEDETVPNLQTTHSFIGSLRLLL